MATGTVGHAKNDIFFWSWGFGRIPNGWGVCAELVLESLGSAEAEWEVML